MGLLGKKRRITNGKITPGAGRPSYRPICFPPGHKGFELKHSPVLAREADRRQVTVHASVTSECNPARAHESVAQGFLTVAACYGSRRSDGSRARNCNPTLVSAN